ncbi:MAG: gamma-glutamyltransferase [Candidatus Marinimicrobia bacterium]|nr:gamma-glutamyltransferase [Candidatus Neomarinimicrobiota bacterium]
MKNVIAAGDKSTVAAAQVILESGGNAFDAAVGACFTAMIAEPTLTGPGGGGHFMAQPTDSKPILFDFFVDTPSGDVQKLDLDFFSVFVDFGETVQEFHIGRGAAAVPGNTAGLLHVHERLGTMPLKTVMEPAIEAAKTGVPLSKTQAYLIKILTPIITHEEESRHLFAPGGKLLKAGDTIVMPQFADFLDVLTHEGVDLIYRGEISRIIADWAQDGGLIRREDLEEYQVKERDPLITPFHDFTVLLNPPPALSGILIDCTFALLSAMQCVKTHRVSLKNLVAAFEETNRIRQERLPVGTLDEGFSALSKQPFFGASVDRINSELGSSPAPSDATVMGATTQISVLDKSGNAASITTTNGEGCGYMLPQAGFMLNNMLGEEDLNPGGFHRFLPRTRLSSMIAPTIVVDESGPVLLTGSAGSNRIRSAIIQIVINHLCHGLDIEAATVAPRIHLDGNVLHAEPGVDEGELKKLEGRYDVDRWQEQNLFFGGANSVTPEKGAGDPRRSGAAIIV